MFQFVGKIDVGDQVEVGTGGESLIVVANEDFGGTSLATNDLTYRVAFVFSGKVSCQVLKAVKDVAVVLCKELDIPRRRVVGFEPVSGKIATYVALYKWNIFFFIRG